MSVLEYAWKHFTPEQYERHNLLPFEDTADLKRKAIREIMLLRQRRFNEACREEMRRFAAEAADIGIRIVFMKGLILAENLYDRPEQRIFYDMDMLADPGDLAAVLGICKKFGYRNEQLDDYEHIGDHIKAYFSGYMHHFPEMQREAETDGRKIVLTLEVHTHAFIEAFHQIDLPYEPVTSAVVQSAVPRVLPGFEVIWTPDPADDFLMLLLHFVKHLFFNVMESLKYNHPSAYLNFRQLLDLDLFLTGGSIDLTALANRAVEWNTVPELVFTMKLLACYSPGADNGYDWDTLYRSHRRQAGFVAAAIEILLKEDLIKTTLLSSWELAGLILNRITIDYPVIHSYRDELFTERPDNRFMIDEFADHIDNHFHRHYKENRYPDGPGDWRCRGMSRWDDQFLWLRFEVEDDELCIEDGLPHEHEWCDSLDLLMVKYETVPDRNFIRHMDIHLCRREGSGESFIYIREYDNVTDEFIRYTEDMFRYRFAIDGNNYILDLGLSWETLGNCVQNDRLIFDIIANDSDSKPPEYLSKLAWASPMRYCGLHDVSSFGTMQVLK